MKKKRASTREGMITLTVAMEPALHRRLAIAGLDENSSMNELIRQAIREFLDRRNLKDKGGHRHDKRKR